METSAPTDVEPIESSTKGFPDKVEALRRNGFAVDTRAADLGFGSGDQAKQQTAESVQIENLVWIKGDPRARAVEEHLEKAIALFEPRVDRNSRQIRKAQDEILRLVGLYCVIQLVMLLCIAQSNVLQCRNLWTPFSLSALSSIITLRGIFQKYRTVGSLEQILSSEEQTLKVAVKRIHELRREGPKYFDFCNLRDDSLKTRTRPATIDYFVVVPLVSFSVIILASFWHVLCKS